MWQEGLVKLCRDLFWSTDLAVTNLPVPRSRESDSEHSERDFRYTTTARAHLLLSTGPNSCEVWNTYMALCDGLSGLVVRFPSYRSRSPEFDSRRYQIFLTSSGSGTQPREDNWGVTWMKKVTGPVYKTDIKGRMDPLYWLRDTSVSAEVGTNFGDKWRSLGGYSSLADWRPPRFFYMSGSLWPLNISFQLPRQQSAAHFMFQLLFNC
jgi:hypothetical protein